MTDWNTDHLDDVAKSLDMDINTDEIQDEMNALNNLIQDGLLDDYQVGVTIDDA
ncbi:MAG: hypothetical protein SPK46_03380 [Candidatus Onthovivens sp.]